MWFLACVAGGQAPEAEPVAAEEVFPATAKTGLVAQMRADRDAPRHPSDGGGRAWMIDGTDPVVVSTVGTWTFGFEVGPLGVVDGGAIFFQVPPFWGWTSPQLVAPGSVGYTVVSTAAEGITLEPELIAEGLLAIRTSGRALVAGETLELTYSGRSDRYAEQESRFWFAVDGDGDGVRKVLADNPAIEVVAGPAARLVITAPTTAEVGETVTLTLAVLDAQGNAGVPFDGTVELAASGGLEIPATVDLQPGDPELGIARIEVTPSKAGVYRVLAHTGSLYAESNPLVVGFEGPRVLWADLHGHSNLSDGTGTPEAYLRYARDVAALDVVALTDHDHWGLVPLSEMPTWWDRIEAATNAANDPGHFVTVLGYEWTSWIHGHRHVLTFADQLTLCDSTAPDCEHPDQLWASLEGQPALTFAHHQSGGPIATNWDIPPHPILEPVTEISSVHGSSESPDTPNRIYAWVDGNDVRSALDRGYRLGLVGSGDSHDGHPGLPHLVARTGGLAAVLSEDLTRAGILEAFRQRRVYATNGPRILLRATLSGHGMGAAVPAEELTEATVIALAVGTDDLDRLDLIRDGAVVATHPCEGAATCRAEWTPQLLTPGSYLYVRAVQADSGTAWSSPWFVD